eukprot:194928_1
MAGRGDIPPNHRQRSHTEPYRSTNIYDNNNTFFRTIINGHEILSFDINNKWIPAKDPIHYDKPDKCGIGPGLSFATLISQLDIVDNNRKIGLIPCAIGGTSIKQWLPKHIIMDNENETFIEIDSDMDIQNDGIFEKTINKCKLALNTQFDNNNRYKKKRERERRINNYYNDTEEEDGLDIELKAILWHQGESDCNQLSLANNYLSATLLLFENMRKYLHNDNIPILVGGLGDFLGKNKNDNFIYYNIINKCLMDIPERLHNVHFVSSKNLNHKGDWLHFNSNSCKILGQRYATKYAKLSGALTNEELNKYINIIKFKNALKKHGTNAYQKTKGISVKTWLMGIVITCAVIYSYKKYYSPDNKSSDK